MKRRIAILGKNGRLGAALCRELADKYEILAFGRAELDLTKPIFVSGRFCLMASATLESFFRDGVEVWMMT